MMLMWPMMMLTFLFFFFPRGDASLADVSVALETESSSGKDAMVRGPMLFYWDALGTKYQLLGGVGRSVDFLEPCW